MVRPAGAVVDEGDGQVDATILARCAGASKRFVWLDPEIVLPTHQVDATNVDEWLGKGF